MSKILFIGDICTDSYDLNNLNEFKKTKLYHFLNNYDGVIVGNLEAPLLEGKLFDNKNKFSLVNSTALFSLYDFCDFFNLSNNHIMDQGDDGFIKTIKNLEMAKKGFFGAGLNLAESRKPLILNVGEKRVALISYCCYSTNSDKYANNSSAGPTPLIFDYIKQDIAKIKSSVDSIIVLPHWGVENEFYPTYDQAIFARKLLNLGVDVIIGSHTHTIQSFEKIQNSAIYYSLGNFFFNNFKISKDDKYYQGKFNKEGLMVEFSYDLDTTKLKEYYVKFNDSMLPELVDVSELTTPVGENNIRTRNLLKDLDYKKSLADLRLELKFNGNSMQVVNTSNFIGKSYKPRIESSLMKFKRVFFYMLRKTLNK